MNIDLDKNSYGGVKIMNDIFTRLKKSEPIHMLKETEYQEVAHKEMARCRQMCFRINSTFPENDILWELENKLFNGKLPKTSFLTPPFQVDYGCQMELGDHVFVNHDLTAMSAGGIILEDGVMIGPGTTLLTVNHDFKDIQIIVCKPVRIKKNAWLGAQCIIMPGITIGEGAIVGSGSVVTHDVPAHAIVVGNPAKVLKKVE